MRSTPMSLSHCFGRGRMEALLCVLPLFVACRHGGGARQAIVASDAGVVRMPSPWTTLANRISLVAVGEETLTRDVVCTEPPLNTRQWMRRWTVSLRQSGFTVQTHEAMIAGEGLGEIALRFRRDDVFGDLYVRTSYVSCWDVVLRLQRPGASIYRMHWRSPLPLSNMFVGRAPEGYCIRFFQESPMFPFEPSAYRYGCQGPQWDIPTRNASPAGDD